MKYTKETLEAFWGGFMSQWARSPFEHDMKRYNCAEQFMMYHKAMHFNDFETAAKILSTDHPREQKALGRQVKGFNDESWDTVKYDIVRDGNMCKFEQNPEFEEWLLETGDKYIVEASPEDRVWGIGLAEHDERIYDSGNWDGQNLLGEVLMEVRNLLKAKRAFGDDWSKPSFPCFLEKSNG